MGLDTAPASGSAARVGSWLSALCRFVAWASAFVTNAPIAVHVARGSRAYLGFFVDDFFYYLIVAKNLVTQGRLTFDGIRSTNGFHPLWLALLALIRLLCGSSDGAFYVTLAVVDALLAIATFELYVRLGRALGVRESVTFVAAAFMVNPINYGFADGMEVNAAIPLSAALLLVVARTTRVTPGRAALVGFLSSLAVLARLDVVILVVMIVLGYTALSRDRSWDKLRAALAFASGGILLPAYLLFNVVVYGAFLSTSATAKQLTTRFGINWGFLHDLFTHGYLGAKALPVPLLAAGLLLAHRSRVPTPQGRFAAAVAIAFPAVYYTVCALRSPWVFFSWYGYALYAALFVGLVVIGEAVAVRVTSARLLRLASLASLAFLTRVAFTSALFAYHHAHGWGIEDNLLTANGFELARRLRDRPGVYAMGDRAGNVANVLDQPIVQLEGLVSDPEMLEHIRAQRPLGEVLQAYGVDYLIVSVGQPLPRRQDCYEITQPNAEQSGERAPKMRGRICAEPIVEYAVPRAPHPWSNYDVPVHTYVFDVRGRSPGLWPLP